MATMKRLIWNSRDSWKQTEDVAPIPTAPAGGALIKVLWSGICRSDLSNAKDNWFPNMKLPKVFGHEICGTVEGFGSEVKPGSGQVTVNVGDTVIVYGPAGCGKCRMCTGGSRWCLGDEESELGYFYGITKDGGFAEYMVVEKAEGLLKVPDGVPLDLACLLPCSGLTSFNAVDTVRGSIDDRMNATKKATLLVIGAGGLGLWTVHEARAIWGPGLQICVADISEEKLSHAKKEGADVTVLWDPKGSAEDLSKKTREVCDGGIDGSTDYVNNQLTFSTTFSSMNKNGTMALIGIFRDAKFSPELLSLMPLKSVNIRGVFMGTRKQLADLLKLVSDKKIKGPPITHVGLTDVNAVFEKLLTSAQEGRAVIDMVKSCT
jgi:propanol-preferring alcohol dehydrogenase